jgi:predicted nucleic acid-binding protein
MSRSLKRSWSRIAASLPSCRQTLAWAGGEAEAITLALYEKAQVLGIDDKNGINACKLLGIAFTTAVGILIRSGEKGLLEGRDALEKLALLAKHGRYKGSIIEDARMKLEAQP